MSHTRPHERAFALILALVFLGTTVATGVAVIWSIRNDNSKKNQSTSEEKSTMLEGTKLEGFTPVEKVDKLEKTDLVVGTGEEVKAGAEVTVHYTGALTKDGTIFQSSKDTGQPISFSLDGVIKGWTEILQLMKVGDKWEVYIPADLAYGDRGSGPQIGPNSVLIFEMELISVN